MKKNVFGRKFKRDRNERKALFKSLMSSLILNSRIKTTEKKAKAIKGQIEKLVTRVKKNGTHVPQLLEQHLTPEAIKKIINEIAPRFKQRPGGYTRIVKLGNRFSDNASMVLIEWVEGEISNIKNQISKTEESEVKENKKETKKEKELKAEKRVSKKPEKNKKTRKGAKK